MSGLELRLFNPNTGNCPTFRSNRDKDIAKRIYSKSQVLWRDGHKGQPDLNPWDIRFMQMFNMTSDSSLFWTKEKLIENNWTLISNHWMKNGRWMVPLYEGKMFFLFDHRYASYENASEAQLNSGQLPKMSDSDHQDPWRQIGRAHV